MMTFTTRAFAAAMALALTPALATAAPFTVTISNPQGADGLFLTPLLSIFHDGTFDTFDPGSAASASLEELAEEGIAGPEAMRAEAAGHTTGVITSPGGFAGAPVIDPGETASITLDLNPATDRYFSYLSMVIPSNDLFIGNGNPTAFEIFDDAGVFTNPGVIQVFAGNIWDAGTEENTNLGAAFNSAGGDATDTLGGVVTLAGDASVLFGEGTVAGTTVGSGTGAGDLLATITIAAVPLPGALPLLGLGLGAGALVSRRRRGAKS